MVVMEEEEEEGEVDFARLQKEMIDILGYEKIAFWDQSECFI